VERSIPHEVGDDGLPEEAEPSRAGAPQPAEPTGGASEAAPARPRAASEGPGEAAGGEEDDWQGPDPWTLVIGYGIVVACFLVYFLIHLDRPNDYLHFVLQAQAWLDGNTSIPMPRYQDVMPIVGSDGIATGRGIIPFPPLPAWVLLPFVSIWHEATNQQLLSAVFGAVDVGIAYWMLGRLSIDLRVRALTSVFFGLGTVLFYTSAIGSTWFFAHVVAVACLLLSVGVALGADPDAARPVPLNSVAGAIKGWSFPGRWIGVVALVALGIVGEGFLISAEAGKPAATIALAGLGIGVLAALLAVAVDGRWQVLTASAVVLALVVGVPGLFLMAVYAPNLTIAIDVGLVLAAMAAAGLALRRPETFRRGQSTLWSELSRPESLQVAAGLLFGLAITARLTILFGFPFLMLVGGGGTWMRRSLLAGAGAAVPLIALLVVTYATSGQLFNPAYDYLYHNELLQYGSVLDYHAGWAITDIRYVPQNLAIMLFQGPEIAPNFVGIVGPDYGTPACLATNAARGLFDTSCPLAMPNAVGMSILLTSPAFMLAPLAWGPLHRLHLDRVTVGATIAVVAIAFVNLMHFSQGWVQFGYRFSNDFVPYALVLVALGMSRLRWLGPAVVLVVLSIVINFWGTIWGTILGW
jgi:hypothetical protein